MYPRIRSVATRSAVLSCVLLLSFRIAGRGQDTYPPTTPFLHIETGMHTGTIRRIDVDASERFLVSASDDKTARVWDLATGELLRTLRPPQGKGSEGKLYAVAISPDGATVALGGYTGPMTGSISLYLFNRLTGRLVRTIGQFPENINHLAYSKDGFYLAVVLGRSSGIRVYRTTDFQEVMRDPDYGSDSYWAEFDPQGRLLTTSFDGLVRLYDKSFRLIAKKHLPGGKRPLYARFSPDGTRVAIGFEDSTAVNILSGKELTFLYAPQAKHLDTKSLFAVAWSSDGTRLYAGGEYSSSSGRPILTWAEGGWSLPPKVLAEYNQTIFGIQALKHGRLAFVTGDPVLGVLDTNGHPLWQHAPEISDYAVNQQRFVVSGNGDTVRFDLGTRMGMGEWNRRRAQFSVVDRQLAIDPNNVDPTLKPPRTEGLDITDWNNSSAPKLNGQPLPLDRDEFSRSLATSVSGERFLLGMEWSLHLFDRQGKQIWEVQAPDVAWSVNLTSNSKYAVAAFGDGTIRWYQADNGREVMGLFVHPDGRRWVMWTPEGFFDCSPGGEAVIGYHLNRGPDHEGEFIKVEQVTKLFYRPDLISQALKPAGPELIAAERVRIGDISTLLSTTGSPPKLELLSQAQVDSNGEYVLQFRVQDQGSGKGRVVYRIDGIEMEGRPVDIPTPGVDTVSRKFNLSPGQHRLSATVYDRLNKLESRSVIALVNVKAAQQAPALFVVTVGISHYRDHALDQGVKFAAQDAELLASRLKQQGNGLFRDVTVYPLSDEKATRTNIEKAIGEIAGRIQANDEFVFYLAGHGTAIDGQYTFVPWEVRYTSADALRQQSLGEEEIQRLLKMIPAKKTLLVLDTCAAGAAISGRDPVVSEKGSIDRLSKITGRAVLAASSSDQMALEGYQNHGVFTYALLEGLSQAADEQGFIQVSRLADYVEDRVPAITKARWGYEQFPMSLLAGQTFPIARKPQH